MLIAFKRGIFGHLEAHLGRWFSTWKYSFNWEKWNLWKANVKPKKYFVGEISLHDVIKRLYCWTPTFNSSETVVYVVREVLGYKV